MRSNATGQVIRTFVFQAHYSNPIDYSNEALAGAEKGWDRLMSAVRLTRSKLKGAPENRNVTSFQEVLDAHRLEFTAAMDDDFNAPIALATLQNLTTEVNKLLNGPDQVSRATLEAIEQTYNDLGGKVLGIGPASQAASLDVHSEDKPMEL